MIIFNAGSETFRWKDSVVGIDLVWSTQIYLSLKGFT